MNIKYILYSKLFLYTKFEEELKVSLSGNDQAMFTYHMYCI